jgi:hypothetical protein
MYNYALTKNEIRTLYSEIFPTDGQQPEFYINNIDISFTNQNPSVDENITIYAKVSNKGTPGKVNVSFYDGDPASSQYQANLINTKTISFSDWNSLLADYDESKLVSTKWTPDEKGLTTIYIELTDVNSYELVLSNNLAYREIIVGEIEETEKTPKLLITEADNLGISAFKPGETRRIKIRAYCYIDSVYNVSLNIIDSGNFTVNVETPQFNLDVWDEKDIILKITAPDIEEDQEYVTGTIIVQAIASDGVISNSEEIDIAIPSPDFTFFAIATATGLGALVAFFRRRDRNR